jgi:hypothetical protein
MKDTSGKLSRRALAKFAAAAAVAPAALSAQAQPAAPETEETLSARVTLRANLDQLAKVKLPRSTEPAFRFKA